MGRLIECATLISVLLFLLPHYAMSREAISLHGEWKLFLDAENGYTNQNLQNIPFNDVILLPGTLDEGKKGNKALPGNATNHMVRKYSYYGKAWYQREIDIPDTWKHSNIALFIERARPTRVYIDGRYAGESQLISAPQTYQLEKFLSPGKHTITILVDNGPDCGLPPEIASSHMWSDDTQTNWNGMPGKIELTAKPDVFIAQVRTTPNVVSKSAELDLILENTLTENRIIEVLVSAGKKEKKQRIKLTKGENRIHISFPLGANPDKWSEYAPNLYDLRIKIFDKGKLIDETNTPFGYRTFAVQGKSFAINGSKTFLRGRHDACVFPLTGYAPMDEKSWTNYFDVVKQYGFNHVRFHSWCPPEAAFFAADKSGVYLQPELPFWGLMESNPDHPINRFLLAEGKAILDAYGNHPSFVMFSSGNELWGDISAMQHLTSQFRQHDNRPLYALGSNYHLGWKGQQVGEDFMVTCRIGGLNDDRFEPHVRSSFSFTDAVDGGKLNATYPNSIMNFSAGTSRATLPVISHETGQFQMYPDEKDLKNYTGILEPRNLEIFVQRVKSNIGNNGDYQKYFEATAALSLICYKADMEMMRRTSDLAGFEMLDLQDFPGQGTALVGILNASMQSKGIISAEEFRSRNNDILPLWLADAFTFYSGQELKSMVKLSNNSDKDLKNIPLEWKLVDGNGATLANDTLVLNALAGSLSEPLSLDIPLPETKKAINCTLLLNVKNTPYRNSYDVWIYPREEENPILKDNVKLFNAFSEEILSYLVSGGNALLMPNLNSYPEQTVDGLFTSDYWNFSMFKSISEKAHKPISPGTLGLLIDKDHPLFRNFPTESHSNWQWWPIVKYSNPIILDSLKTRIKPVVETIDNVERVHALGTMFECRIGKGKLFVCMTDLKNHTQFKENNQLYNALITYLNSPDFNPTEKLDSKELKQLFTAGASKDNIKGVKNISY